jgi:hypothetical protein
MAVIQNQLTDLSNLISIDGTEITEHGRVFSSEYQTNSSAVELSRGLTKKYFKKSKRSFTFNYTYLPESTDHTVDGRAGRNFLRSLVEAKQSVNLVIKDTSDSYTYNTNVFITSYNEDLIRRDFEQGYAFYNITIIFEEL